MKNISMFPLKISKERKKQSRWPSHRGRPVKASNRARILLISAVIRETLQKHVRM